ncbi:sulfurtransferase [Candidatus Neomarinimicrobiota bacterium]
MTNSMRTLIWIMSIAQIAVAREHSLLVSTGWLEANLHDPALTILHVGPQQGYAAAHVPGAQYANLRALILQEGPGGNFHELPDPAVLDSAFESYGISSESRIILTPADDRALPWAARLFVTLDYLGLGDQTALLDGGLDAWLAENRPTTTKVPDISPSNLKLAISEEVLVDRHWLKNHLREAGLAIVDGRPVEYYTGDEKSDHIEVYGHIAGASSLPFTDFTGESAPLQFKSPEEITRLFSQINIDSGATIITYCDSGIWGAVPYLAARSVGYNVRFYDGSFQDWVREPANPVIGPVRKKGLFHKLKDLFN